MRDDDAGVVRETKCYSRKGRGRESKKKGKAL